MVITERVRKSTQGNIDIMDITADVQAALSVSNLKSGTVTIFSPSSTSGLTTIEYENGCLKDLRRYFEKAVPSDIPYAHNDRWHDGNGHSHIRAALLGASLSVPFCQGKLMLGTWQQIIFVDFDVRPRQREMVLQLIGE